jgi:hypothetical protein
MSIWTDEGSAAQIADDMLDDYYATQRIEAYRQRMEAELSRMEAELSQRRQRREIDRSFGPRRWLPINGTTGDLFFPGWDDFYERAAKLDMASPADKTVVLAHFAALCRQMGARQPDGFIEERSLLAKKKERESTGPFLDGAMGCYGFLDIRAGTSLPVYIGKSRDLGKRLLMHPHQSEWFKVWTKKGWGRREPFLVAYWLDSSNVDWLECHLISRLRPVFNQQLMYDSAQQRKLRL